jgi:hypothetical protein
MTAPIDRVRETMHRTMANLKFIEANARPGGPFEVTQLVNSVVGALAHPWEDLRFELMEMPIARALLLGWPDITTERLPHDRDPPSLGELIRCMRNGLTHGNIALTERNGEIERISIVSYYPTKSADGRRKREWGATITIRDLRAFLDCFVELADSIYEKRDPRPVSNVAA